MSYVRQPLSYDDKMSLESDRRWRRLGWAAVALTSGTLCYFIWAGLHFCSGFTYH